jgi:hypothetical protein
MDYLASLASKQRKTRIDGQDTGLLPRAYERDKGKSIRTAATAMTSVETGALEGRIRSIEGPQSG